MNEKILTFLMQFIPIFLREFNVVVFYTVVITRSIFVKSVCYFDILFDSLSDENWGIRDAQLRILSVNN